MRKRVSRWMLCCVLVQTIGMMLLSGVCVYAGEGKVEGYVQHRSEYGFRDPSRYAVSEFDINVDTSYKFDEHWGVRSIIKGTYDGIYDFSNRNDFRAAITADPTLRSDGDAIVKELYFDYSPINQLKFRLGKQVLTWGEADGLRLMDMINPQDLRRGYLTRDLEDRKEGLWMLRADYDIPGFEKSHTYVEFLWIDDFKLSQIAPGGAAWAPAAPEWLNGQFAALAGLGLTPVIEDNKRNRTLKNSRYGAKLSSNVAGADVSLNYLYSYGDAATFNFNGVGPGGTFNLAQNYPFTNLVGATINYDTGMGVLRGEFSYEFDKPFQNVSMPDWTEKSDYFKGMIGFDYNLIFPGFNKDRSFFISGQIFDFHIMDHNQNIINIPYGYNIKKDETIATLMVNTGFLSDSITPQMFVAYDASYNQWWIQPSLGLKFGTWWRVDTGANWFEGKNSQRLPFGAFKNDSTAFLQVKRMF